MIIIITCFFALSTSIDASMTPKQMRQFMQQTEKGLKLDEVIQKIQNGGISQSHLQIIYLVLRNTPEYYSHNLNGVTGNKVYVHKDGHKEAVYDKNGKLVQDGINDGSYNYFDRNKEPLKHFSFDTNPWIIWGSSPKDPTSKKERIFAFVSDLEAGLRKSLEQKDQLKDIKKDKWDREGQIQALAIIIMAQEKGKSKPIHELFDKKASSIKDRELIEVLKGIEAGLNKMY